MLVNNLVNNRVFSKLFSRAISIKRYFFTVYLIDTICQVFERNQRRVNPKADASPYSDIINFRF